jgi:hypothetical protein
MKKVQAAMYGSTADRPSPVLLFDKPCNELSTALVMIVLPGGPVFNRFTPLRLIVEKVVLTISAENVAFRNLNLDTFSFPASRVNGDSAEFRPTHIDERASGGGEFHRGERTHWISAGRASPQTQHASAWHGGTGTRDALLCLCEVPKS